MAEPATTPESALEGSMFEQPLNERLRPLLRLDFLYSQALYHNERGTPWGSRAAIDSLLDILAILTRGDMRSGRAEAILVTVLAASSWMAASSSIGSASLRAAASGISARPARTTRF